MVHDDNELDRLLMGRSVPEMRSNLEHRILQSSLAASPEEKVSSVSGLRGVVHAFFDLCLVPRPALAMIIVLGLGLVTGGAYTGVDDVDAYFLAANEVPDMEGFYE